jgi:hypothetical protein
VALVVSAVLAAGVAVEALAFAPVHAGPGTSPAGRGAGRAAPSPGWSIVFSRNDSDGYISGFDVLSSGDHRAHGVTSLQRPHVSDVWLLAWSPDGRRIVFDRSYSDRDSGLYVVDAAGGKSRALVRGLAGAAAWSPDSTRIAFSSDCFPPGAGSCRPGVYVAYLNGSPTRQVYAGGRRMDAAASFGGVRVPGISWAPDGKSILCLCDGIVQVIAADGSGHHALGLGTAALGPAFWSARSTYVAFEHRCTPARPREQDDFYCQIGMAKPSGARVAQPRKPACTGVGTAPVWTSDEKLLVEVWGCGPTTSPLVEIDPKTGTYRGVSDESVSGLTSGPNGTFGFVTSPGNRPTLVIMDRNGHALLRRPLPANAAGGAILLR